MTPGRAAPGSVPPLSAMPPTALESQQARGADREELGRIVRETWVAWAREQAVLKPSWLVPWDELDPGQREVDMRIGEAVARATGALAPRELREAMAETRKLREKLAAVAGELAARAAKTADSPSAVDIGLNYAYGQAAVLVRAGLDAS